MNTIFIIKVEILVLITWVYISAPIMFTPEPRMVTIFGACSPISLEHVSLCYPFLKAHITKYHSDISVLISKVTNQGLSTLSLIH